MKKEKSFTLIELMVATAIFLMILTMISGFFISAIRAQRMVLANQEVSDQISYALEYMSRSLRMAKKELGEGCLSQRGLNYESTRGGSGLKFINTLEGNDCQEFFLENNQLKYWKRSTGQTFPLTSNTLKINSLIFNLIGQHQDDDFQPRVTIFLEMSRKGSEGESLKIQIQTTISQRNLDVQY